MKDNAILECSQMQYETKAARESACLSTFNPDVGCDDGIVF